MIESMQMIMYALLIVLIIIGIIVGIKLIMMLDKVDNLIIDVTDKVKSFDKVFDIVSVASDKVGMIGETVLHFVSKNIKKLFFKNVKNKEDDDCE